MSICLCNLSADVALEHFAKMGFELEPASPDPATFTVDSEDVVDFLADEQLTLPRPLELLVGSNVSRRPPSDIATHTWRGPLPKSSFLRVDDDVYVTSPELTLLQQATQLHQANLCQMLGRYLGTWTPDEKAKLGQSERAPLVTFEQLSDFLKGAKSAQGIGSMRLAMAYTCENAASAPESTLQLTMSLPPELHGFVLPQPTMNHEVELSDEGRKLYPHDTIRIDVCWRDAKFGFEYQGEEHADQLGDDYARWYAARDMGYELWPIAKEQLQSATQMQHIGREAAKKLGLDVNAMLWPSNEELQDLLDTLWGKRHPNPVSYKELRTRRSRNRMLLRELKRAR